MDLDKLLELHGLGRSQREIAGELGVSQPAVAKALKRVIGDNQDPAITRGDNPGPDVPDLTPPRVRSGPGWKRWVDEVRTPWLQRVGARDAGVSKRER